MHCCSVSAALTKSLNFCILFILAVFCKVFSRLYSRFPGGGVLPYKGLMGTCGQPGYVFRGFRLKQGIEFIIFCLNQGIDLSIFVLNRMSFLGR